MKKLLSAAAAAIMCMSMGITASADLIIEPMDDFYSEHSSEIEFSGDGRDGRQYVLTKDISVYDEPGGKKTGTLSAGKSPVIRYIYTDNGGRLWGGYFADTANEQLCWICLDGLEAVYDRFSFAEEHKDEITDNTDRQYSSLKAEGTVYLWEYPGSTEYISIEKPPENFGNYIGELYTDEMGGKWGYIGYMYGANGWVYISDPSDTAPFSEDVSAGATMSDSVYEETSSAGGYTAAALLALAAAGGSAILIALLNKKGTKPEPDNKNQS